MVVDLTKLNTSSRVEYYTVDLLDQKERKVGELEGLISGSVSASVDARIKTAGKLEVKTSRPISWWSNYRLQIWAHSNGETWSLGVFIPSSPRKQHKSRSVSFTIDLLDKLTLLDQDCIPEPISIPVGTRLTVWLKQFITEATSNNPLITQSNKTNKRPLTWEVGTPKLSVVNDVLDYIGYFSLTADGNGNYSAIPYVVPAQRPISWVFGESLHSLTSPDFTYQQDLDSIPNQAIYIVQSVTTEVNGVQVEGTTTKPLVAVSRNMNPDSPFSYPSRGRWITTVKTDCEAESKQELQQMVDDYLENAVDPFTKIEFSTAIFPVRLNELARFTTVDYDLVGAIRKIEYNLRTPSLMKITIRKSNYELG